METHLRSLVKAGSWRLGGLLVTMTVVYAITRKAHVAATIGLADTLVKLVAYYVHERLWLRVKFGLRKPADYEI
jgi:uncharacterized membrane protein